MTIILLSYPRSGNHFVRFIIEYISNRPTAGCYASPTDTFICVKQFKNINLLKHVDCKSPPITVKWHVVPPHGGTGLILIVRNFIECISSHKNYNIPLRGNGSVEDYMKLLSYYNNYTGLKLIIYYEDLINNPKTIAQDLYTFLKLTDSRYLKHFLDNTKQIIHDSKQCISNKPPVEYAKLFPPVTKNPVPLAYRNKSGNDLLYHGKKIPTQTKSDVQKFIVENYSDLKMYVERYFN